MMSYKMINLEEFLKIEIRPLCWSESENIHFLSHDIWCVLYLVFFYII